MIRIGTSGYNHRDWIGSFYPAGMGPARYLARYADEFDLCELAVVVHRLPHPAEAERILGESAGRLLFTALAPRHLVAIVAGQPGRFPQRTGTSAPRRFPRETGTTLPAIDGESMGRRSRGEPGRFPFPDVGAGFLTSDGVSEEIAGRDYALDEDAETGYAARTQNEDRDEKRSGGPSDTDAPADVDTPTWAELDLLVARLGESLAPYARAGRFRGLVLPLPRRVEASEEALATVARIGDRLQGLPLLIEPRDGSWVKPAALGFLREAGVGLALADGPDPQGPALGPDRGGPRPLPARRLAPFAPVTSEIACVRFHGRDGETRWAGGAARRDYLYSWEELVSWLPALRALAARARELVVVFNNPWRERAIENARMMRRLIGDATEAERRELGRLERERHDEPRGAVRAGEAHDRWAARAGKARSEPDALRDPDTRASHVAPEPTADFEDHHWEPDGDPDLRRSARECEEP